ncbi:hypothetical protein [Coxiella-like endosymbiont of Rhipicephalus sanguineus]|uniref:hypothetical protein n=1 Tax=Coxiella-like endosymbiont of Rhipicephalus sanguineus TaxID=1955402 RepID=UPI00203ABB18
MKLTKPLPLVIMAAMKEIGLPHKKVNLYGGALCVRASYRGFWRAHYGHFTLYFYKKIICNAASPPYASAEEKQQPLQLKEKLFKTYLTLPPSFLFGKVRVSMRYEKEKDHLCQKLFRK